MPGNGSSLSTPAPTAAAASVLVVDDDLANRESLSRRLSRRGIAVLAAADGPEALALIERENIDVVLLDVMMPGMSGLEVLQRIRQTFAPETLPVIMATAKDQSEDIVKALALGANDYVTKPLDFPALMARVQTQLALKRSVRRILDLEEALIDRNAKLETANAQLVESARRTAFELEAAAKVQMAFLPTEFVPVPGLRFAWAFEPCKELAGDSLNIVPLGGHYVGFYVLDVSGHGAAASLLAVAANRLLSVTNDAQSLLTISNGRNGMPEAPAEVARRLNHSFPWNPGTEQFLTLLYALVDASTLQFTYASAGHPGAVRVTPAGKIDLLEGSGMPIGVGDEFDQRTVQLEHGDRVYLYSDGITEAMNHERDLFGAERLLQALRDGRAPTLQESIALLLRNVRQWEAGLAARDDVTVVAVECE